MSNTEIKAVIRKAGFRATNQRIALLEYLTKVHKPESISQIASALGEQMDLVTIYRVVESFVKAGLLRQVDLRKGYPLFEIADAHDHHHIVCTDCGKVEDFNGCDSERLTKNALKQSKNFSMISGHSFELFGRCNICTR